MQRTEKRNAFPLKAYKKRGGSLAVRVLLILSAAFTAVVLAAIIIYTFVRGIPNLRADMFALKYTTDNHSMTPAIINTITITALSLLIAFPLGLFSAIYLEEYAKKGSKIVLIVSSTAETLSGIPSIVYGLFGNIVFVVLCGFSQSILAGALTLAIMILPTIMRTSQEAVKAVDPAYREGSFGLGAGRLRTVFKIVLPAASSGIFSGVILAIGKIVGETAALLYTAGSVSGVPSSLMGSGRTLAVHMYALINEGLYTDDAYAVAAVLIVFVFLLNMATDMIEKKITKRKGI